MLKLLKQVDPISVLAFLLTLLPCVNCTCLPHDELSHYWGIGNNGQDKIQKVISPRMRTDMILHGFLLWFSMGFLMPLGMLAIRMSNRGETGSRQNRVLFYLHVIFQTLSSLVATVGAGLSLRKFENSFDNNHQRLGLAIYGAIWVQTLIGVFRPPRGKKGRPYWYFAHWLLGTTISLVGIINIYTGLRSLSKRTSTATLLWSILFTAQISSIGFLYLLQDKMEYLKKQGMILDRHGLRYRSSMEDIHSSTKGDCDS